MHKTTKQLENLKTVNRILEELKRTGSQSAADLALKYNISVEGARQQLTKLMDKGLVAPEPAGNGVGRPSLKYSLTETGHRFFPDGHRELTVQILNTVEQVLGQNALDAVIHARAVEVEQRYRPMVDAVDTLEEKLDQIRIMRCNEGYMAEWRKEGETYLFIENHCPIGSAVQFCTGFCKAELNTLQSLLGDGYKVRREEHLPNGDRRCMYLINVSETVDN